jgi:hypothetical protein
VQLDGFDQRRHLSGEHGGHPRQPRRHLLWFDVGDIRRSSRLPRHRRQRGHRQPTDRIDLSTETHPPTPSDLIAGIDRVEGMLSNTIKLCERVKRPRMTSPPSSMPLGLRNATHVASRYMKCKIQIESGLSSQDRGSHRNHLDEPCPIHEKSKHTTR